MNILEFRKAVKDLEHLCRAKIDAADAFKDSCKATAKQHGVEAAELASYVQARVNDKVYEYDKRRRQMELILDSASSFDAASAVTTINMANIKGVTASEAVGKEVRKS